MKKMEEILKIPSLYNIFVAIVMLITWFLIFSLIYEMNLENALIISMLIAMLTLILTKFKYLVDKKRNGLIFKNLILFIVPSFGYLIGIVGIFYFWQGYSGEITFIIALSSYALLLLLIPVKTTKNLESTTSN
ncbi:MAG: hypothetical protein ACTSRC_21465 [Candidatus Helarchaeota archaeon]